MRGRDGMRGCRRGNMHTPDVELIYRAGWFSSGPILCSPIFFFSSSLIGLDGIFHNTLLHGNGTGVLLVHGSAYGL